MRYRLLDLLRCPDCGAEPLALRVYRAACAAGDERIEDGELRCQGCGARYPVIAGVPRMLPRALRPALRAFHHDFFALHPDLAVADGATPVDPAVARTLLGFSYQHVRLADTVQETERWRRTFLSAIPVGPEAFAGKLAVDLGCGAGRQLYCAREFGAEVVGVDLSEGVAVARRATAHADRCHVVQGDIHHLPLRPGAFDLAYSIGVLHHLPDPREGFRRIVPLLAPGGRVFVWVYGLEGMRLSYRLSHLTWLRGVSPRLPHWAQHALSASVAGLLELALWTPCRVLAAMPGGREVVARVPLGDASHRSFRAKTRSVFDRLNPPVTHYHRADELAAWLAEAALQEPRVLRRDGRGFVATGVRAP
jgi:SAM-dependent methyltransferase/uncharacterized protein YbaR (Trm112 family)